MQKDKLRRGCVTERKFVSTRILYGGTSAVLYWKKSAEETCGLKRVALERIYRRGRGIVHFAHYLCAFLFLLGFEFAFGLVLFQACIVLADQPFDLVGSLASKRGRL
jgi:hypothetical protein